MKPLRKSLSRRSQCWLLAAGVVSVVATAALAAVSIKDAGGRTVVVDDASRIVSVGGSITEILYATGLQAHVLAIDSTSFYPPQALKEKPNVGYMRQLSAEGVLGLGPSVVMALEGAGPKETIAVLEAASVPFVSVPDRFTGDGILEKIRFVSEVAGASARGACLAGAVGRDLDSLAALRKRIERPVRVLFLLSFMGERAMVAGQKTAADGIIRLAGADNAISGFEGYKLLTDEAIIAAKPDVVLAMQRDSHPMSADTVFAHPAMALTPAAGKRAFVSMDGLYLLGFGPRTALAARDLAGALYPALKDAAPAESAVGAANCTR